MNRAKSMCKHHMCPALLDEPGYCPKHFVDKKVTTRAAFKSLDDRKTLGYKRFYSSAGWTNASLRHRTIEPLCRPCKAKGKIVEGTMVHHTPEYTVLIERGLNPLDDQYLSTLCDECHLEELRAKRKTSRL